MSSGYNELKLELLEEADNWEEVTAGDMARALRRTHCSIAMAMLRYHRQGLLSRHTIHRNEKVYALTDRGLERLEWLMEQASDDDDVFDEEEEEEDENDDDDELFEGSNYSKDYESLSELERELLWG